MESADYLIFWSALGCFFSAYCVYALNRIQKHGGYRGWAGYAVCVGLGSLVNFAGAYSAPFHARSTWIANGLVVASALLLAGFLWRMSKSSRLHRWSFLVWAGLLLLLWLTPALAPAAIWATDLLPGSLALGLLMRRHGWKEYRSFFFFSGMWAASRLPFLLPSLKGGFGALLLVLAVSAVWIVFFGLWSRLRCCEEESFLRSAAGHMRHRMDYTAVVTVVILALGGFFLQKVSEDWSHLETRRQLLSLTRVSASMLSPEQVQAAVADKNSPGWQAVEEHLTRLLSLQKDIRHAFLLTRREGRVVYVADGVADGETTARPGDFYKDASMETVAAFDDGRAFVEGTLRNKCVSALIPIPGPAGRPVAFLGLDLDGRDYENSAKKYQLVATLVVVTTMALLAVFWRLLGLRSDQSSRLQKSAESLYLFERVIQYSVSGIVITDMRKPDNPVVYVNPAFSRITGYKPQEILGDNCRFLQGRDKNQPASKMLGDAIRNQRDCTVTLRNYRKNGEAFWNQLAISPVFDARGEITHYVGMQSDVTERVELEKGLKVLAESAPRASGGHVFELLARHLASSLGVRSALIAHLPEGQTGRAEILAFWDQDHFLKADAYPTSGTPCGRVLAEGRFVIPAELRKYFPRDAHLESVAAESYLGEALKDASGKTIGHLCVMNSGPLPGQERLKSVFRIFALRAAAELERAKSRDQIKLVLQRLDALVESMRSAVVLEDEQRRILKVNQPFCALFAPDRKPESFVSVPTDQVAREMSRTFTDPDAFLRSMSNLVTSGAPRVLEKLVLSDGRVVGREYIPIRVDDQNRGHLWFYRINDSVDGGALETRLAEEPLRPEEKPVAEPTRDLPGQVLVVDDHDISRKLLLRMLEDMGCQANELEGGREVASFLERWAVDVVLLDLQMPGMDGYATARQLRSRPETRNVWLVAMTASVSDETLPRCQEAGMNDFLKKPVSRESLRAALQRAAARAVSPEFTGATSMDSVALLDLEQWNNVSDNGNPEVLAIWADFVREIPGQIDVLREAEKKRDWDSLKRMAHQLKGTSSSFGMARLSALAAAVEKNQSMEGNRLWIEAMPGTLEASIAAFRQSVPGVSETKG